MRGEDGSDMIFSDPNKRPYFYVKRDEVNEINETPFLSRVLRIDDEKLLGTDWNKVSKVTLKIPKDVSHLRLARVDNKRVFSTTYESRILFPYVYLIDNEIYAYCTIEDSRLIPLEEDPNRQIKLRKFALDIETGQVGSVEMDINHIDGPITIIGINDNFTNKYHQWYYYPELYKKKGIHSVNVEGKEKSGLKSLWRKRIKNLRDFPEELEYVCHYFDNEYNMLDSFLSWWEKNYPDVVHAWYGYGGIRKVDKPKIWRPGFDFPYLIKRIRTLGLNQSRLSPFGGAYVFKNGKSVIKGIQIYDLMFGYDYWLRKTKALGLGVTGKREAGFGKIGLPMLISRLSMIAPQLSRRYNLRDVELCVVIDQALEIIERSHRTVMLVGAMLQDSQQNSRIHMVSTLRKARGYRIVEFNETKKGKKFKGGHVVLPKPGVHNGYIAKIDLSRAYPYAQIDLNMSPETKYRGNNLVKLFDICTGRICRAPPSKDNPNGVCFWKSPVGLAPRVYKDFLALRAAYTKTRNRMLSKHKDKDHPEVKFWYSKEYTVKPVTNSYYGVLGMPGFMLYDRDVASSVTATIRYTVQFIIDTLKEFDVEIVAGDTDSVMFRCPFEDKQAAYLFAHAAVQLVNKRFQEFKKIFGIDKVQTKVGLEEIDKSFIVPRARTAKGSKKRYSSWVIWKDGTEIDKCPDITGFEEVKGNTPRFSKDLQKLLLKKIHKGATKWDVVDIIQRAHEVLRSAPIDYIGIRVSLHRNLHEYSPKSTAQHVEAIKYGMRHLGQNWRIFDTGKMIFVKASPSMPPTEVIVLKEKKLPEGFKIDIDKTFERIAWNMIKGIVELIGIEKSETLYENSFSQGYGNALLL